MGLYVCMYSRCTILPADLVELHEKLVAHHSKGVIAPVRDCCF